MEIEKNPKLSFQVVASPEERNLEIQHQTTSRQIVNKWTNHENFNSPTAFF